MGRWDLDRKPTHEDLSMAFLELASTQVKSAMQGENLSDERIKSLTENVVFSLAMMFDQGKLRVSGQRYRPALTFKTELGDPVLVSGSFDLHDYALGMVELAFEDEGGDE